jgi:hypothetical protein
MVVKKLLCVRGATVVALMVVAICGPRSRSAAHNRESQVTWTTDVEPILQRRCVGCHAAGGFGPMPLATYQDARAWAKSIRQEVLERRMPPWPAARGFGDFLNDRSLTPVEVELLTSWADGATPLGPPVMRSGLTSTPTEVRQTVAHHESHDHGVVIIEPTDRRVTALVDRIELATDLDGDRWVTGWEFEPGNRSIVQQAVVWMMPASSTSRTAARRTFLGAWTPSEGEVVYPSGVAQRLPAGSRLAIDLHYRRSATPQIDRSGIRLRFGARPNRELRHRSLSCGASTMDRDVDALAVTPRAAEAGASLEVVARHADGSVEPLSVVPRYEPGYPISYRFRENIRLRRGTTIDVRSSSPGCSAELEFVGS